MLANQNERWIFIKGFSPLGKIQKQATLSYSCEKQGPTEYCFSLVRECEGNTTQESTQVYNIKEEQALQMVRFLYENAIPIENWQDVLKELEQQL